MRLLFICSRNQWRSPTAEAVYQKDPRVQVRSAGLSQVARTRVSAKLLQWADLVCVMEQEHKQRLREAFPGVFRDLRIEVLDIPDEYPYMDPVLVGEIVNRVEPLIEAETAGGFPDGP